jgi:glycosyltransferase involved in cell wall biosynthesis/MoaA/NifB/PqqE/SkfB family radical SAM enzyme
MNILMLHPHDVYSNSEPWTVRVTYLAKEFVKRGHRVRLIYHLLDPKTPLAEASKRQEYPFTTIPAHRYQFALVAKMRHVLEEAKWADVIHFQKCFPHVSVPSIWAGMRLNKPVHYDWDDWEYGIYNYRPLNRWVGRTIDAFERIVPRLVDTVSVASDELWRKARALGVPEHKIFEAHVGGDLETFRPDIDGRGVREAHEIDGPIVLYLGQLHGAQYAELYLRAARLVLDQGYKDVTFLLIGSGERFGELYQLAETLQVAHKVVFTGAIDHDQVPRYVAAADVAVAAFEETSQTITKSPLKVCEYLAMGKAIVASRMGEVVKMLDHGRCGVLVEPGNAEELAAGIVRLLRDPELRRELSVRARKRAEEKYNWGYTAENLLTAYEMALTEYKHLYWKVAPPPMPGSPESFAAAPERPSSADPPGTATRPSPVGPAPSLHAHVPLPTTSPAVRPAEPPEAPDPVRRDLPPPAEGQAWEFTDDEMKITETLAAGPTGVARADGVAPVASADAALGLDDRARGVPKRAPLSFGGRVKDFVHDNLDIVGVLDGEQSYVGPHTLQIDPTNRCNNDCIACWCRSPLLMDKRIVAHKENQTLPFPILKDLIDDIVDMGSKEVYIAGGGEPFMHPQIMDLIEYIKVRGLICNVNTNFTLVSREVARRLVELRVDFMTVSVWAGTAETYAALHPNKTEETFEQIRDVLTFLNGAKATVPYIKVYNVISNLNFFEIHPMVRFAEETRSDSVEFTVVDTIPDRTDSLLLGEEQRDWLYKECLRIAEINGANRDPKKLHLFKFDQFMRRISGEHTTTGDHDAHYIDTLPCTVGWQFARVLADGEVNSCLKSHRIPLGTLYEHSFRELWTSEKQREFRRKTNVAVKDDPFFSSIGNDPSAKCGCHRSCDDLGRIEHLNGRMDALSPQKRMVLRRAKDYLRLTGRYVKPEQWPADKDGLDRAALRPKR